MHIWEYNNYPGYIETQKLLRKDVVSRNWTDFSHMAANDSALQRYQAFLRQLAPMLRSRQNQMLLEFAFWQGSTQPAPSAEESIYELRSYLLKPGKLLEWETEWYGSSNEF